MNIMISIECLDKNIDFQKTSLFHSFKERPLGFIDIGSAGGVHPLIAPVASLTHCTCFEPDERACQELRDKYGHGGPFPTLSIVNTAIGSKTGNGTLYMTESPVNTSLLKPNEELVTRYKVAGFRLQKVGDIKTSTLDDVVFGGGNREMPLGEVIKMDCQGAEHQIIQGARRVLKEQCLAVWCEFEFFPMYRNQKLFSEVDLLLRQEGFQLYGLYPNYISAKKIDRRKYNSEERLAWADAFYLKDPLEVDNEHSTFSARNIEVLLLVSMLTGYFDYALELIDGYYQTKTNDQERLKKLVLALAEEQRKGLEADLKQLLVEFQRTPEMGYLLGKKFIDKHKSNNNIDFISI
ncbi:MAG: FkbM family methyltransferase [Deltaproteobacteria bacterium]|nr:FkbM family methyltransferase [Deltaproteobacteria bacterium]